MSVTPETDHSLIGPCGPLEHSPTPDSFRHAVTAPLSSALVCGENAARDWGRAAEQSCEVGRGRTKGWQRPGQCLHRIAGRQGSCDSIWLIWGVRLHAHHCKNSETCRHEALGKGEDTKVTESVHVGGSLCFCLCHVFMYLSACNCPRKRMHACLLTRTRMHFAVLSCSPQTAKSRHCHGDGGMLSYSMCVCVFVFLCFEV